MFLQDTLDKWDICEKRRVEGCRYFPNLLIQPFDVIINIDKFLSLVLVNSSITRGIFCPPLICMSMWVSEVLIDTNGINISLAMDHASSYWHLPSFDWDFIIEGVYSGIIWACLWLVGNYRVLFVVWIVRGGYLGWGISSLSDRLLYQRIINDLIGLCKDLHTLTRTEQ